MNIDNLRDKVETIWKLKQDGLEFNKKYAIEIANEVIDLLDEGKISVVEKQIGEQLDDEGGVLGNKDVNRLNNGWIVKDWIKKGILLSFLNDNTLHKDGSNVWFDKCSNKFSNWMYDDFIKAKIRVANGAFARKGAFFDKGCIIMPSFVNIGANVGEGTMIDSMTTIGSCAKIGAHCHVSANVCIGGVLEPLQANPVIIEDNCFIGAGSNITEGVIVGEGSVIASNVSISASVKIVNRQTGEISNGYIPPYSVVVAGCYESVNNVLINCAVIIKTTTPDIRKKVSINDLLR